MNRRLFVPLAIVIAAVAVASATGAIRDPRTIGGRQQLVDLTVRPSGTDLARLPGTSGGYAVVYDDRLGSNALRYGERRGGGWRTRVIVSQGDVGELPGEDRREEGACLLARQVAGAVLAARELLQVGLGVEHAPF